MDEVIRATITHLQQFYPYQRMEMPYLKLLAENCETNYFKAGEIILDATEDGPPDTFFIIKKGFVESHRGPREQKELKTEKNAFEYEEGDAFPYGPLISNQPNTLQFVAVTDCFVYQVPAKIFHQLREQCPTFRTFCEARIASLLEESKRLLRTQQVAQTTQQPLSIELGHVIKREVITCGPEKPLGEVLKILADTNIGSMAVVDENKKALGIFTLNDVLRRVAIPQVDLSRPISDFMTSNPITLAAGNLAYEAALTMAKHGFRHIFVVDNNEKLLGVVSERDLFALQRVGLTDIAQGIESATNLDDLCRSLDQIKNLSRNMLAQGVAIEQLTHLISHLNDQVVRATIKLRTPDHPEVEKIDYVWIAMGSEGREEQLFYTDQDNGIIFKAGDDLEKTRATLLAFATDVNHDLDKLGFPLCTGNIMAMNPECCLSDVEWRQRFNRWINNPDPEALLNATIFFDFKGVAGNVSLAEELRAWLSNYAKTQDLFLRFLTQNALRNRPPLGLIKDFTTREDGTINLKFNGAAIIVDIARILALQHGSSSTNTVDRLKDVMDKSDLQPKQLKGCIEVFAFIQLIRMKHHFDLEEKGLALSNNIDPKNLDDLSKRVLREGFRLMRNVQNTLTHKYRL
ncbi:MAG: CBS domain-containing protein [Alcaligenaceae bacterium]|jgi:CBS domain-containing protein|nr:CBS domain-containing protein [Alcaligenaceae bacterium]